MSMEIPLNTGKTFLNSSWSSGDRSSSETTIKIIMNIKVEHPKKVAKKNN